MCETDSRETDESRLHVLVLQRGRACVGGRARESVRVMEEEEEEDSEEGF